MKTVILCGGKGTRLREETEYKPKPMVLIGGKPILWHIMKIYSYYGHKDFIICLGYKGEMIRDYFLRLAEMSNDFTLKSEAGGRTISHHQNNLDDWNITFVNTGEETMTGDRVAQIKRYIGDDEDFFLTYGDGVADVDINSLYNFHKVKGKIVTLTAVRPMSYYGVIEIDNGLISSFQEKPRLEKPINGGFFVCNKRIFNYLSLDKDCVLEETPLRTLSREGNLAAYEHHNFWFAVDTYKQWLWLNKMWDEGRAVWKVWNSRDEKCNRVADFTAKNDSLPVVNMGINNNINQYWKNKNVFITGCTGLLGSWMVQQLVDMGANVTGLARDIVPESNLYKNGYYSRINIARGQLEDLYILERILGEYEIDTVFHLAAQTIVGIANRNPVSTFESNIRGTYNLLEVCRRSPLIKRIVVASSDKAYGDQKELPYHEDMPLQGTHPYDVSKSCVDLLAQAYFKTYNLPVCITRCGNLFGGGDLNFNRIIPGTIKSVLQNEPPIVRSDGTLIRDYFYVRDAVDAYLLIAEKMNGLNIHGQAFNFSNENQITVLELVRKIINLAGSSLEPIILNQATNEIKHQYLSAKKAREILGWQAKYGINEGLIKTINWYKKYMIL